MPVGAADTLDGRDDQRHAAQRIGAGCPAQRIDAHGMQMNDNAQHIATTASAAAYSICGTLITGKMFHFLDTHAAAIGVLLGVLTYATNLVFKFLHFRAVRRG